MTWLLCYDIEDDKLRLKIARMLEKDGLERLQKSVFAAGKNTPEFLIFFDMVKRKIAPLLTETDKIYAWKLSDAELKMPLCSLQPTMPDGYREDTQLCT